MQLSINIWTPSLHPRLSPTSAMENSSLKASRSPSTHNVYPRASTQERSLHIHSELRIFKFDDELAQEEQRRQSRAPLEVITSARTPCIHRHTTPRRKSQNIKFASNTRSFARIGSKKVILQRKPSIQEINSLRYGKERTLGCDQKEDESPANSR
jgi:hypothetical protein